ncbi:DUF1830 domain-containing protein [Synechococcus sp. B60.1]|uniref:DUF1830 domain-containing protein n=1 Tax=unclassified Synechococcus TaxID=2626047 RepID=UPI0039C358B3
MKRYVFVNRSQQVQVIRTIPGHWERTLFPGQYAIFEAEPDDYLEVYSCCCSTTLLEERHPCHSLLDSSLPEAESHSWLPPHLGSLADAVNG